jgi:hypothetical protein
MRLFDIKGRLRFKNVSKKLISWNKKSRSKLQKKVKDFLKPYWKSHICYEEFPVYGTRMSVDLLNATRKIAIEVNGEQHEKYNKFFHKNRLNYYYSIKRDFDKKKWLEMNEYTVIEINHDEIDQLSEEFFLSKFNIRL